MASILMHDAMKKQHALRGRGRACPCCTFVFSVQDRRRAKARQRRIENRQWRREWDWR